MKRQVSLWHNKGNIANKASVTTACTKFESEPAGFTPTLLQAPISSGWPDEAREHKGATYHIYADLVYLSFREHAAFSIT